MLFYPFPISVFRCGSILFPFPLSIVAPGAVRFCILCNIPSLHPFEPPFLPSLPHLSLPSILGTPFPSCHKYAFHTPRTLCRLNRLPPSIVSGIGISLLTCTRVGHSVHMARFCRSISPTRKGGGGLSDNVFRNLSCFSVNLFSMLLKVLPLVFCLPIVWRGARSPHHTIEVNNLFITIFFIFIYYSFCILFYFK